MSLSSFPMPVDSLAATNASLSAMKEIFLEIDDDGSGTITIRELLDFTKKAEKQLSKKSRRSRYGGILKRCCLTIGWWTSWSFITGAVSVHIL